MLARYGVGAIVMDSYEYMTGAMHGLVRAMAYPDMAGWKLVVRGPAVDGVPARSAAGSCRRSPRPDADHLESECRNLVEHDPKYPNCALKLAFLVARTNPQRAARMFALYFDHGGDDADARRTYQELLLSSPADHGGATGYHSPVDPILSYAQRTGLASSRLLRQFVECESPSDDPAAVNRFVDAGVRYGRARSRR